MKSFARRERLLILQKARKSFFHQHCGWMAIRAKINDKLHAVCLRIYVDINKWKMNECFIGAFNQKAKRMREANSEC